MNVEVISEHACFGGVQRYLRHDSRAIGLPMRLGIYLPPQALQGVRVPAVIYLAGLTCTEETFPVKAGAQRIAAELGLALVSPDTSPRGAGVPGEAEHWDFGVGAGFYLDATQAPWRAHWRMESYVADELRGLLDALPGALPHALPGVPAIDTSRLGLMGHSMGGHGALTLALRHPGVFRTLSAIAPIAAPSRCPWGIKAFTGYLGEDRSTWAAHDASELMRLQASAPYPAGILVDQGEADNFLADQLHPEALEQACAAIGQPLALRRHAGYDHGYYFIQTVIEDHLRHHAGGLG